MKAPSNSLYGVLGEAHRWYLTQRANRRDRRFVINVPAPTVIVTQPPAAPPPAPPTARTRLWGLSKTVGPALISLAAITISLATFLNQRAANIGQQNSEKAISSASIAAAQRQWAEKISFLQSRISANGSSSYATFEVQNSSISPMTDVILTVSVVVVGTPNGSFNAALQLNNVPPCSVGYPNVVHQLQLIAERILRAKIEPSHIGFQVNTMYFTDRSRTKWAESVYGSLDIAPTYGNYFRKFSIFNKDSELTVSYKSSDSCS